MNAYCPPQPCPPYPPYPPFPANPSVGDRFGSWVWNGSTWVVSQISGFTVNVQAFKASGTYQPSPGLVACEVECVGGGGAGGSSQVTYSGTNYWWVTAGGGGGAGGSARVCLAAALVMGGVNVVIGGGGAPSSSPSVPGGAGQDTSFGAFCVAKGGSGGGGNLISGSAMPGTQGGQWGEGGAGGVAGAGDITTTGNAGGQGATQVRAAAELGTIADLTPSGKGAGSVLGGSPITGAEFGGGLSPGVPAPANSGAGGSGAITGQTALGAATSLEVGGAGGSGFCTVREYIMLPASMAQPCPPPACPPAPCPPSGQPCAPVSCDPFWYPHAEQWRPPT